MQIGACLAENSGRWVKLTAESAEAVKKYGLMPTKTPGVSHAMIGEPGDIKQWLQVAQAAWIRPFRAVIIHAREMTARGFAPEMAERANRDSGAIQPAGDVALGRRMRGVSRLPAISW